MRSCRQHGQQFYVFDFLGRRTARRASRGLTSWLSRAQYVVIVHPENEMTSPALIHFICS